MIKTLLLFSVLLFLGVLSSPSSPPQCELDCFSFPIPFAHCVDQVPGPCQVLTCRDNPHQSCCSQNILCRLFPSKCVCCNSKPFLMITPFSKCTSSPLPTPTPTPTPVPTPTPTPEPTPTPTPTPFISCELECYGCLGSNVDPCSTNRTCTQLVNQTGDTCKFITCLDDPTGACCKEPICQINPISCICCGNNHFNLNPPNSNCIIEPFEPPIPTPTPVPTPTPTLTPTPTPIPTPTPSSTPSIECKLDCFRSGTISNACNMTVDQDGDTCTFRGLTCEDVSHPCCEINLDCYNDPSRCVPCGDLCYVINAFPPSGCSIHQVTPTPLPTPTPSPSSSPSLTPTPSPSSSPSLTPIPSPSSLPCSLCMVTCSDGMRSCNNNTRIVRGKCDFQRDCEEGQTHCNYDWCFNDTQCTRTEVPVECPSFTPTPSPSMSPSPSPSPTPMIECQINCTSGEPYYSKCSTTVFQSGTECTFWGSTCDDNMDNKPFCCDSYRCFARYNCIACGSSCFRRTNGNPGEGCTITRIS